MKRLTMLAILMTIFVAYAATFSEYEDRVKERTLDNGLKILIYERHNNPTAAFVNYVDVGAVNEFEGQSGVAHFLEHLAFKGTKTVGTRDFDSEKPILDKLDTAFDKFWSESQKGSSADSTKLSKLFNEFELLREEAAKYAVENEFGIIYEVEGGVGLNAYTSQDQTVYHVSLPSNKAELWTLLESDRIQNPIYRLFYEERDVIVEERSMRYDDSPSALLREEMFAAFYKAHPYHDPVIGHRSEMTQLSKDDIVKFSRTYYHPGNMTIVVVGDVDTDETFDLIDNYFGNIPPGPEALTVRAKEPELVTDKRITMYDESRPFMMIGYLAPNAAHKDFVALKAFARILGQGNTSRLYKRLVAEEEKALYAGCGIWDRKYDTPFLLYIYPSMGVDSDELLAEVEEEIAKLINEPPTKEELNKVINIEKADFIFGLESNVDMATSLATYENVNGDWRKLFRFVDELEELKPSDIQRVAKKYFENKHRVIAEIKPPIAMKEVE